VTHRTEKGDTLYT